MDSRMNKLQKGALLHDIGKIYRRSDFKKGNSSHVKAGVEWLGKLGIKDDEILDIVKYHHYNELEKAKIEKNSLVYIVYEADNIASGIDRIKREKGQSGNEMSSLNSIFNSVNRNMNSIKKSYDQSRDYINGFNIPKQNVFEIQKSEYNSIVNIIKNRFELISNDMTPEKLITIFEDTCQYIPSSSYIDYPDVSYYDHVKITTAVAGCMYLYDIENNIEDYRKEYFTQKTDSRKKNKFLVVCGKFKGIQDFIYNITSKSAMKSLRGRSFYLELFIEHIIDEILLESNLTRANLLYCGGGQFYMILPNIEKSKNILEKYKEIVNSFLLKNVGIKLYYEMVYTETNVEELGNGFSKKIKDKNIIGNIFERLNIKISKGGLQRYSKEQLNKLLFEDSDFNYSNKWDNTRECGICRKNELSSILDKNILDTNISICNSCKSYIEIGRQISSIYHNNDSFLVEFEEYDDNSILELPIYNDSGSDVVYLKMVKKDEIEDLLKNKIAIRRYYSINEYNLSDNLCKNIWVGNYNTSTDVSNKSSNLIEFRELVSRSKGIKRLAVLRADIDNLADIFQTGFEDRDCNGNISNQAYKYLTLSKSAVLSRYLSDFFKKNVNNILEKSGDISKNEIFNNYCDVIKENNNERRNIVLVYSGGDDLFAIGTWDDIIEFSIDVHKALRDFTGDKITLSAGIGFFNDRFPIYNMAQITSELEKFAKKYSKTNKDRNKKNSVALFGKNKCINHILNEDIESLDKNKLEYLLNHIYSWDDFINGVLGEKYRFIKNSTSTEEGNKTDKVFIGKSKWYRIMDLINERLIENNSLDIARFAYILARITKTKENEVNYNKIKSNLLKWIKNEKDAKELLTAINLRIYELRGE